MTVETFGVGSVLAYSLPSSYLNLVVVARKGDSFGAGLEPVIANTPDPTVILPTDDWPFLYLEHRTIPGYNLVVVACVLVIGAIPILVLLPGGKRRPHWNFYFLGA